MSLLDNDDDLVNKSDAAVEIWHIRKKEEELRIKKQLKEYEMTKFNFTIYDGYGSANTENEYPDMKSCEDTYGMKYYIF